MIASNHDATVAPRDRSPEEGSRYRGGAHGRAVGTLTRAILDQDVLVLLTGAAGVGKTVVLNSTLAVLTATAISVIRLDNPSQRPWSQRDLVHQLLDGPTKDPAGPATGAATDSSPHRNAAAAIGGRIAATAGEARVVIAVDDAHTLTDDAIELLLLLASPARGSERPPQLILSGRGEFWERDPLSELLVIARLAERVILDPLTGQDAMDYVAFRLKQASGSNHVISSDALTEILNYSGGLPAQIDEVLAPANSIRACRGSNMLTGDMVEAAIATMASVPDAPPSAPSPTMTRTETSSEDWVSSLRLIYRTQLSPDPVSPASAVEGSTLVLDRGEPVLDPESRALIPPMFRSQSPRVPPAGGNAVVPFQVESTAGLATTLMIRYIAPGRRRLGRTATAAATFVMIIGSLACVISLRSTSLANAIIWPWSSGSAGSGGAHADRPLIAPAQPGATRANVPEATAAALPTEAEPPSGAPGHDLPALDNGSPSPTSPASVRSPVTASVAASGSGGLPGDQTVQAGPVQTSRPLAGSPPAPPPVVAGVSPQMATFLVERGNLMLQQGDVLSAQLYFEQAAEAGSRQGAIGAAKTFDPAFLATIDAPGLKSDVARAIKWYRQAFTTFGDQYASERLKALATQTDQ